MKLYNTIIPFHEILTTSNFTPIKEKLKYLMINLDINTGKFIYKCFELRTLFK